MISRYARWAIGLVAAVVGLGGIAQAQDTLPFEEVRTLSSVVTPIERKLEIGQSGAGSYKLVLTDLALPATPMSSVKLALTRGSTVVGTASTTASETTATLNFDATPGEYIVRIVGVPPASGQGTVGVGVYKGADTTTSFDFIATLGAPALARPNQATIVATLKAKTSGTYEVLLNDFAFPQALTDLIVNVTDLSNGNNVVQLLTPGTGTFTAVKDAEYQVTVVGAASDTIAAGLFSVRIRPSGATDAELVRVQALGRVNEAGSVEVPAGATVLSLHDLQFPAALAEIGAAVSLNGAPVASTTTSADVPFTSVGGQYSIYSLAKASGTLIGSYGIEVRTSGGPLLFSSVKTEGGATGESPTYQFVTDIAAAGTYRVRLADFAFPGALTEVQLGVSQDGQLLGTLSAAGSLDVANVKAGSSLYLLAIATPSVPAGAVFGIDVTPAGGSTPVFEATQGVGNLFRSRQVSATGTTAFRVALTDLGFPRAFKDLGAIVTRGATPVGKVLNSAQFDFNATPGNYFINFIATPDPTEPTKAGTYGIRVAEKPPAPVVTLTSSATQVATGGDVTLSWSVTNASACTASNGWSGSRAVKGDELIRAVNAAATYKLECTGEGGTGSATVSVSVVAETSTDGGGGGALGWLSLIGLALAGLTRWVGRRWTGHRWIGRRLSRFVPA